jgi:hypothetical protein
MSETLLYIGSIVIILWGIAYIIPTKAIVNGFGEISEDNRRVLTTGVNCRRSHPYLSRCASTSGDSLG